MVVFVQAFQDKTTMKRLLYLSLLLNVLLASAIVWAIQKLGGFGYTWHRITHREWGVYYHRVQHFARLPERPGATIFVGDSQIAEASWQEMLDTQGMVLNRGISGDYTAGVLERLPEIIRHKPRKIYLLVGINDLFFGKSAEAIAVDYQHIVQQIRSETPDSELYLMSVLPVNNLVRDVGIQNMAIQDLNTHIQDIAHLGIK
jgi:hypothetical protein